MQQGRNGTQLRPKIDGQLGTSINKGAIQGSPLCAQRFALYFDAMLNYYDNAIHWEIKQAQSETIERNEIDGRIWTNHLWKMPRYAEQNINPNRQKCAK